MQQKCFHWYVKGRVQGVWFRASTKTQAEVFNLTGWVKNLPDGRVEVLAVGDEANLNALHAWLKQGPALAKVTELIVEELPLQVHEKFEVV